MARSLKVFRTSAGFHDAYVAAPSRKAALAAWGADADLFARGMAEQVTDRKLIAAPLRTPGEVVMVSRGTLADQLKAAGPRKKPSKAASTQVASAKTARNRKPPSRTKLDRAEAALTAAERRHAGEMAALEAELARLQKKVDARAAKHRLEATKLKQRRKDAEADYRDALDSWSA